MAKPVLQKYSNHLSRKICQVAKSGFKINFIKFQLLENFLNSTDSKVINVRQHLRRMTKKTFGTIIIFNNY